MEPTNSLLDPNSNTDNFLVEDTPDENEEVDYFNAIVGEGKKFRDTNALAKSKIYSDQHIKRLEEELASERSKNQQNRTVDEILTALQKNTTPKQEHDSVYENREQVENRTKELSVEEIVSKVQAEIEAKNSNRTASENLESVKTVLKQTYGASYPTVIKQVLDEKGLDLETLNTLAKKSPKAALSFLGVSKPQNNTNSAFSPNPKVSSESFNQNKGPVKDFAYFEKIRKSDPKRYETTSFQMEMMTELSKQYTR